MSATPQTSAEAKTRPTTSAGALAQVASKGRDATVFARILVVDDQPANVQIVGSILGKLGHEIIPAADGMTALKRVALRKPDLILLDLLMPEMNGVDVCTQLKSNPETKDIPVIFLSAADDKELIVRALNAGGIDYITKPFNQAELISRVRTQLALKSAHDRLAQIAEDKDELIGILTHDLKNHIGGISMSAALLHRQLQTFHDGKATQLSENILRSSEQLLAFVKEFLANAATDYGFALRSEPIDVVKIGGTVVRPYQEAARRKKLELHTDLPAEAVIIHADASALSQVLDNLISNAVKFSPPDRRVFFTVRATDKQVECIVKDEGPGFNTEDKEKMFRRYGRLSARPTGGEPSTGLGLSIVLKLVKAMNGELLVDSAVGAGATFTIRLPRLAPAQT
ncbi:MAG TPA: hybrid sensor histidine kinase/response regulator [Candidatus Sulfotelmatobacter sp.]|nr:hybrid sensor histidine kinase/response regulator [Candidatus Sulfotelmatobacter sp.]